VCFFIEKIMTETLTPQETDPLTDRLAGLPVWVRPPRNSLQEFYTGLSRAKLYELASTGRIKSRSLREEGQTKGTRLFNLKSVLDFIELSGDGSDKNPV